MRSIVPILLFVLCASPLWAGTLSVDLNDHSTQIGFSQNLPTQTYGDSVVQLRYLYNDHTDTNLLGAAAGVSGSPGNIEGLKFGFNLWANGASTQNDQQLLAIGLGASVQYAPPALHGVGFDGHLIYSPDIFVYQDAKEYAEWGFGASYQVLPNARITLAYQNIQADVKDAGDIDLDDTVRVGLKLDF